MKQFARFSITCTSKESKHINIYNEFQEKLKKYLFDEDMELYRVPITSEEYHYAHELTLIYDSDEDWDEVPGLYVYDSGYIETVYSKQDFNNAVAYLINFWYIAYSYDDTEIYELVAPCCKNSRWKYENVGIQKESFQMPLSEFKNRKYAQVELGYGVDREVVDLLIENELARENDFQEIKNKKGNIVCYQIRPENIISGFAKDNNMHLEDKCDNCGLERYSYSEEPYYIKQDTLNQLIGLNQTKELIGNVIEKKDSKPEQEVECIIEPQYIVNKEVYELLKNKYPKMQFIPIFLKQ